MLERFVSIQRYDVASKLLENEIISNRLNFFILFYSINQNDWSISGVKALFQFAWQVYIYGLYTFINDPSK